MEVHHHPIPHKAGEKKNFKEYFLEFLMIFLAVTLGFFAENLRENINDKHTANENIRSMIEDLRADSISFTEILAANEYSVRMIDTLIDMLGNKSDNTAHIYFLARNITAVADEVKPDTRTFDQMKTEGSFRLLKNKSIANDITFYYQSLKWFELGNNLETQRMDEVITANSSVFNGTVLKNMFTSDFVNTEHNTLKVVEPFANPPLMTDDAALINIVIVRYGYFESVMKENNGTAALEIDRCAHLITVLRKEYNAN